MSNDSLFIKNSTWTDRWTLYFDADCFKRIPKCALKICFEETKALLVFTFAISRLFLKVTSLKFSGNFFLKK